MEGHWGSKAVFEHRTVSIKLVNMKRKNRNKSSVPKPTIGAYPKAQSASSQRVQGLQLATVTAETSMSRQKKRRTRHRAKERNELGTILCDPYDKKKAIALAQERRPGSWMLPTSSKGKAEFCALARDKSLSAFFIQNSKPIFFCGDGSNHIDGIPQGSIVMSVQDLVIVDTIYGFKFPMEATSSRDDIVLVRRSDAIEHQPNHRLVLEAFELISDITKSSGVKRGKGRIVSFQEGSNGKYLTPGIFPERACRGTGIRSLQSLDIRHHQAIFKFVMKCERLAMSSMSLDVTRGFAKGKKMFPYRTFPGVDEKKSTHMYSSIASACNVCLNSHTDNDSVYGVVTNMEADRDKQFVEDDDITLYFTFPTLGLAVALRPGDILFFNPTLYHSVSSRRDIQKTIWCTSLYTKNAIVGGNNNSVPLNYSQKEMLEIFKNMIKDNH